MSWFFCAEDPLLTFQETFTRAGLLRLDRAFEQFLAQHNQQHLRAHVPDFYAARYDPQKSGTAVIEGARLLSLFLSHLFPKSHLTTAQETAAAAPFATVAWCKRQLVQRDVARASPPYPHNAAQIAKVAAAYPCDIAFSVAYRTAITTGDTAMLTDLRAYAQHQLEQPRRFRRPLFQIQERRDPHNPIDFPPRPVKIRTDFHAYDPGITSAQAMLEAHACLKCHKRAKDSCRTGMKDKRSGAMHAGCPLEQKISEMMVLKEAGADLAALAVVTIDNPMVAVTGHRICNDCRAACIFQKQDAIDIPGAESQILQRILALPYGAEIYGLLLRWHPLRAEESLLAAPGEKSVCVVGLGPAGFALSYHLVMRGYQVLAIDGSEILPAASVFPDPQAGDLYAPIKDYATFAAHKAPKSGFGGVAEYGITARWQKSYLRLIRLQLERFAPFTMQGCCRFGSTLDLEDILDRYGFDYCAIASGAGRQKILQEPQELRRLPSTPGVRHAADFLMTLQLLGAGDDNSMVPLDIDAPIHVIGGGLTAIDCATEAKAYLLFYLRKLGALLATLSREQYARIVQELTPSGRKRFHVHHAWARRLRDIEPEDTRALQEFIDDLGGVHLHYHRGLADAAAVKTNPHEVQDAIDQGVHLHDHSRMVSFAVDEDNRLAEIRTAGPQGTTSAYPARSLFLAVGTEADRVAKQELATSQKARSYAGKYGFFGDADPAFEGSVVKALASAKAGARTIAQTLSTIAGPSGRKQRARPDLQALLAHLSPTVCDIRWPTQDHLRFVLKAPLHAQKSSPGHLFRLHVPHRLRPALLNLRAVPVLLEQHDPQDGTLTFCVACTGLATQYLRHMRVGDRVSIMGPTGAPFPRFTEENIVVITTPLRLVSLYDYLQACRAKGQRVTLFLDTQAPEAHTRVPTLLQAQHGLDDISVIPLEALDTRELPHTCAVFIHGHARRAVNILSRLRGRGVRVSCISNAPMQCMMKALCSQCLHVQTGTDGIVRYFYACAEPYQALTAEDVTQMQQRLEHNEISQKTYFYAQKNSRTSA